MSINFQRFGIAIGQDAQLGILLQRPREIDEWPAEAGEALPRMARWLTG